MSHVFSGLELHAVRSADLRREADAHRLAATARRPHRHTVLDRLLHRWAPMGVSVLAPAVRK